MTRSAADVALDDLMNPSMTDAETAELIDKR